MKQTTEKRKDEENLVEPAKQCLLSKAMLFS